ncbi:hypothetical protein BpHYR1_046718 [Brachionus plicatilis]|uniref:Uncharacterized protein n=1 Tax=Brachionus plicatilis TaxID=10195 RepID=A0A3M7SDY2_BRAPC|nr:hypothetical protein BpHYR1_046718 [Brachionus plicatilis]
MRFLTKGFLKKSCFGCRLSDSAKNFSSFLLARDSCRILLIQNGGKSIISFHFLQVRITFLQSDSPDMLRKIRLKISLGRSLMFRQLSYLLNFGNILYDEINAIVKNNFNYWHLEVDDQFKELILILKDKLFELIINFKIFINLKKIFTIACVSILLMKQQSDSLSKSIILKYVILNFSTYKQIYEYFIFILFNFFFTCSFEIGIFILKTVHVTPSVQGGVVKLPLYRKYPLLFKTAPAAGSMENKEIYFHSKDARYLMEFTLINIEAPVKMKIDILE